ncbi:MAG: hypothetical protein WEB03_13195, partial [Nitriliruptor sp.]|uniref:hypothetical protein n=1 Tax=Nitriliruptor sp. TaxID=2448056 RepID=UPI0034A00C52
TLDLTGLLAADLAFDDVAIVGSIIDAIDLDSLDLPALPLTPSHGAAGPFTDAECDSGIGAAFCSGTTPTVRQTLRGQGGNDLSTALRAHLEGALAGLDLVSTTGEGALLSLGAAVEGLTMSAVPLTDGLGAPLDGTVADFGQRLGQYSPADQLLIVEQLLSSTLAELGVDDLLHLSGRYSSYPALTVDTSTAPVGGEYQGTLTVTLVE